MKIEFYHLCLDSYDSDAFKKGVYEQIPQLISKKYNKKVYKVQFYTDFYSRDKGYLFIDGKYSYYPLTVIFPNRKWEVMWIRWITPEPKELCGKYCIYPAWLPEEGVTYELCDDVPTRFKEYIIGKNLYGTQPNNLPLAVIKYEGLGRGEEIGVFSTPFADTLRTQVYEQLLKLSGTELTSGWEIYVTPARPMIKIDNISYLSVSISNKYAECYDIGVYWLEDVNTCDFVSNKDVTFHLTDKIPGIFTCTIEQTVKFIQKGGNRGKVLWRPF